MKKHAAGLIILCVVCLNMSCRRESDPDVVTRKQITPSAAQSEAQDPGPVFPDPETVRARLAARTASERSATQGTAARQSERRQRMPMLKNGEQARMFETQTWDGKTINLDQLKGKTVLLNFWASWCGPCRHEMPFVKRIAETYKDNNNFAIVGISLDRSERAMKDFINRQNMDWPNVFDGSGAQISSLYGVKGIPYNLLIGPEGAVIATGLRGQAIAKELSARL
jgi:thiol-disulfide isomerase/thioredoxin